MVLQCGHLQHGWHFEVAGWPAAVQLAGWHGSLQDTRLLALLWVSTNKWLPEKEMEATELNIFICSLFILSGSVCGAPESCLSAEQGWLWRLLIDPLRLNNEHMNMFYSVALISLPWVLTRLAGEWLAWVTASH